MTLLRSVSHVGTLLLLASAVHAQGPAVRRITLEQALALAAPASETVGLARAALSRARAFIVDDGGYFAPALEHEDNLGHAVSGVHNWRDVPEGKLRERPITREDFDAALRTVRPSVGAKDRARYDAFTRAYGIESSDASS
jgi:hypothetical protein